MRLSVSFAVASALALTSSAALADDPPVDDAPPKVEVRYPPSSVRFRLFAGGVGLSGGAYALSFAMGSGFPEVPGFDQLKIPFVGPWLTLAKSGCASDDPGCDTKPYFRAVGLVIDGIAQAAGLGLILEGIVMKTESAAPVKSALTFQLPGGGAVHPLPLVSAQITGLGVVGSF